MLPSEFQEVQEYPYLKRLLGGQVDMIFIELRGLLGLPKTPEEVDCRFTTAAILFNLISGISVWFNEPNNQNKQDSSKPFKKVLREYYPPEDEITKDDLTYNLYTFTRNSLVHSLGIDNNSKKPDIANAIVLNKPPLSTRQVLKLENSGVRPDWLCPTVMKKKLSPGNDEITISIPTLYWGTHRMLHNLFSDNAQITQANESAKPVQHLWHKVITDKGSGRD